MPYSVHSNLFASNSANICHITVSLPLYWAMLTHNSSWDSLIAAGESRGKTSLMPYLNDRERA
ncbi:MAG: hypothetical protein WCS19_08445 [Candidatus Cloacimonadaceae bacterium]